MEGNVATCADADVVRAMSRLAQFSWRPLPLLHLCVQALSLTKARKQDAVADSSRTLGLAVQTLRHLATERSTAVTQHGGRIMSPWSLSEVCFSPSTLMGSFLHPQQQKPRTFACCRSGTKRWVSLRAAINAVLADEVLGPLLATTQERVGRALQDEKGPSWWSFWDSAVLKKNFITDAEAAEAAMSTDSDKVYTCT